MVWVLKASLRLKENACRLVGGIGEDSIFAQGRALFHSNAEKPKAT